MPGAIPWSGVRHVVCGATDGDARAVDGVSYQAVFGTRAGEWMEIAFTPRDFRAVWRGQDVPQAPALRFDRVASMGFLISDKQEGEFRLELRSITASDVVAQQ